MRVRGHRTRDAAEPALETRGVRLDARDVQRLSTMFGSPAWLRDLGRASWLLVGFLLLLVGFVWLLGETAQIVVPVVAATIVAVVAAPVVDALDRHMPRAAAAAIVLLALVGAAVLILVLVIGGIVGQSDSISTHAAAAATKVAGWLESLGVGASGASKARESVVSAVPAIVSTLTHGVLSGVRGLASLVFGLSLAALSLFFLLEDGPSMRRWVETHLGMPAPVRGRSSRA